MIQYLETRALFLNWEFERKESTYDMLIGGNMARGMFYDVEK